MKSFKQFKEGLLDQKRADLQKDATVQRVQSKMELKKDKRAIDLQRRLDQIERDMPDETADEVVKRLRR